jgi:putative solute:sodium symporter small subunit
LPASDSGPTDAYKTGNNPWFLSRIAKFAAISRVIPSPIEHDNQRFTPSFGRSLFVTSPPSLSIRRKIRVFTACLLGVWTLVAFGWVWFARALDFKIGVWTFNFWMAAQGSLLVFLLLTVVNAWCVNRWEKQQQDEEAKTPTSSH